MIYNSLFSADNRLNEKAKKKASKINISTLEFNHENPTFAYTLKVMKAITKSLK